MLTTDHGRQMQRCERIMIVRQRITMIIQSHGISAVVALMLLLLLAPVDSFAPPATRHRGTTTTGLSVPVPYALHVPTSCSSGTSWSSLKYYHGSRSDSDDDNELLPSALPKATTTDLNDEKRRSSSNNNIDSIYDDIDQDALCDYEDVDCHSFLPQTQFYSSTLLPSDTYLASQLKTRSDSIEQERIDHNWKTATCPTSFVSISNSDYIRRVDMETYPIVVCGGARGGVYVVNLDTKNVIGMVEGMHLSQVVVEDERGNNHANMAKEAMEKLYGKLDGGGVVSVAIHGDIIASSGREGGVRLWKVNHNQNDSISESEEGIAIGNNNLVSLGTIPDVDHTIVTCLKFDYNDRLWTACFDGTVRAYNVAEYSNDSNVDGVFSHRMPLFQTDFTDSVLDMHLCEELQVGVCATADGGAALFHMNDGQFFGGIILSQVSARSVLILKHRNGMDYSVLCGTSDGIIHSLPLNINAEIGSIYEENPFRVSETTDTAIKPRHVGPVMCMTSPGDGIFVSGGQDGALRVWNCFESSSSGTDDDAKLSKDGSIENNNIRQTKCMYALTGYKLWLGSACTDGKRLVSDGGENSIVIRDFSSGSKNQ